MPEQPSTLAARIRAKYPGVYDDVSDIELEQKVSAKYPGVYDDVPRTEATLTRERAPAPAGQLERGNIDLRARPTVKNADGSISTVRSLGVNLDGREVLIPTVTDDGRVVSDEEAIDLYRRTGKHLGKFDTPQNATAYAESLHNDQAQQYGGMEGHHPDTLKGSLYELLKRDDVTPSDAAFLKRGPDVGGAAGMVLGGPLGAGVGAAAGSLVKGQAERGAHMPTGGEAGQAALDGGFSALLAGAPRALAASARTLGPAVAKNAGAVSKGVSALTGIGAGVASGNPLMGLGAGAATKALTSPRALRTMGKLAGRAGNAVTPEAANKLGFGALSAEAFRKALLDALGAEPPASTVP
jgi:hypothetical protein